MISNLSKSKTKQYDTPGKCANCKEQIYESQLTLNDCYNVWMGKCPYCDALNYLSLNHGLRGYGSNEMHLVLPTMEEIERNGLSKDIPNSGYCGKPAKQNGSNLGEFCHKLFND